MNNIGQDGLPPVLLKLMLLVPLHLNIGIKKCYQLTLQGRH